MASPSPAEMVSHYEELRGIGMTRQRGAQNLGLALFIHRGMAAWMRAWADYGPTKIVPKIRTSTKKVDIPAGTQNNMVMVLVSMILNSRREIPL
jgi:hypothetical protein